MKKADKNSFKIKDLFVGLYTLKNVKLSKLSILLIILMDVFCLHLLFAVVEKKEYHNPSFYQIYPYWCSALADKAVPDYGTFEFYGYHRTKNRSAHVDEGCFELDTKYKSLIGDENFSINMQKYKFLKKDRIDLAKKYKHREDREYRVVQEEKNIEQQIKNLQPLIQNEKFRDFYSKALELKKEIKDNKESIKIKFILKRFLNWVQVFGLLLLISGFFVFVVDKKKNFHKYYNPITLVIFKNLMLISGVPLAWITIKTVYFFLPKHIIENVLIVLGALLNLVFGVYTLIFLTVAFVFWLVYFIQKREASGKKQIEKILKKIRKGKCYNCNNKVDYKNYKFCPFCGIKFKDECRQCGKDVIISFEYCNHCGSEKNKQDK